MNRGLGSMDVMGRGGCSDVFKVCYVSVSYYVGFVVRYPDN